MSINLSISILKYFFKGWGWCRKEANSFSWILFYIIILKVELWNRVLSCFQCAFENCLSARSSTIKMLSFMRWGKAKKVGSRRTESGKVQRVSLSAKCKCSFSAQAAQCTNGVGSRAAPTTCLLSTFYPRCLLFPAKLALLFHFPSYHVHKAGHQSQPIPQIYPLPTRDKFEKRLFQISLFWKDDGGDLMKKSEAYGKLKSAVL